MYRNYKLSLLFLASTAALLSCGDDETQMPPEDAQQQMLTAVAAEDFMPDPAQSAPVSVVVAGETEFDFDTGRVRFPGQDWIRADEFWDIYRNDPARLPPKIDPANLERFRSMMPMSEGQ